MAKWLTDTSLSERHDALCVNSHIIFLSDAMLRTRLLAEQYARRAESLIDIMTTSESSREQLRQLTHMVTNRDK